MKQKTIPELTAVEFNALSKQLHGDNIILGVINDTIIEATCTHCGALLTEQQMIGEQVTDYDSLMDAMEHLTTCPTYIERNEEQYEHEED